MDKQTFHHPCRKIMPPKIIFQCPEQHKLVDHPLKQVSLTEIPSNIAMEDAPSSLEKNHGLDHFQIVSLIPAPRCQRTQHADKVRAEHLFLWQMTKIILILTGMKAILFQQVGPDIFAERSNVRRFTIEQKNKEIFFLSSI